MTVNEDTLSLTNLDSENYVLLRFNALCRAAAVTPLVIHRSVKDRLASLLSFGGSHFHRSSIV